MVGQAGQVATFALAGPDAHLQGVQGEVGAQGLGQLPAHHAAGEHVDHERRVDPAGEGAAVGDVSDPQLVGCRCGELTFDASHATLALTRAGPRPRSSADVDVVR